MRFILFLSRSAGGRGAVGGACWQHSLPGPEEAAGRSISFSAANSSFCLQTVFRVWQDLEEVLCCVAKAHHVLLLLLLCSEFRQLIKTLLGGRTRIGIFVQHSFVEP
ncbi:hypothetical protein MHYP_G00185440 [Metynnis hypsauchen]